MATKTTTVYMRGKIYWAKILGEPRPNYARDGREWTFEFEPDDTAILQEHRLMDRLKNKTGQKKGYEDRGDFLTLKRKELKNSGEPNDPIRIVDSANQPWDEDKLIGNGTVADVKINIVDYGPGKKHGIYPQAIRVMDLVAYQSADFAPVDESDEYYKPAPKDTFREDFGLEPETEEEAPKPKRNKKAVVEDLDDEIPV